MPAKTTDFTAALGFIISKVNADPYDMGDDGCVVFSEIATAASKSTNQQDHKILRDLSLAAGIKQNKVYTPYLLKKGADSIKGYQQYYGKPEQELALDLLRDDFFECIFMAKSAYLLEKLQGKTESNSGINFKEKPDSSLCFGPKPFLFAAGQLWQAGKFAENTAKLFDISVEEDNLTESLQDIPSEDWLQLIMRIHAVEFVNRVVSPPKDQASSSGDLTIPEEFPFPLQWGLQKALEVLKRRTFCEPLPLSMCKFEGKKAEKYFLTELHDDQYLASHVLYALSAASSQPYPSFQSAEWLYKYCSRVLSFWMSRIDQGYSYIDLDIIAELVEVLRPVWVELTASDANSDDFKSLLTGAAAWLAKQQIQTGTNKNEGSWPTTFLMRELKKLGYCEGDSDEDEAPEQDDTYDIVHPTWVAMLALLPQEVPTEPETTPWTTFVNSALEEVQFGVKGEHSVIKV